MRFVIVDGLDGAGKDTHAQLIRERYQSLGEQVILRTHPSNDNYYGRKAKKALLGRGKLNKIKASIYYALDVIRSLKLYYGKGDTLIFVRYLMGVAYLPLPLAKLMYHILGTVLPTSDYMFFLDLDPKKSLKRISHRDDLEMFENLPDLFKVREKALELSRGWQVINTTGSIPEVQEEIDQLLQKLDKKNFD